MFRAYTNEFKYNLRDELDISEIIDIFTSEDMENMPPALLFSRPILLYFELSQARSHFSISYSASEKETVANSIL